MFLLPILLFPWWTNWCPSGLKFYLSEFGFIAKSTRMPSNNTLGSCLDAKSTMRRKIQRFNLPFGLMTLTMLDNTRFFLRTGGWILVIHIPISTTTSVKMYLTIGAFSITLSSNWFLATMNLGPLWKESFHQKFGIAKIWKRFLIFSNCPLFHLPKHLLPIYLSETSLFYLWFHTLLTTSSGMNWCKKDVSRVVDAKKIVPHSHPLPGASL